MNRFLFAMKHIERLASNGMVEYHSHPSHLRRILLILSISIAILLILHYF